MMDIYSTSDVVTWGEGVNCSTKGVWTIILCLSLSTVSGGLIALGIGHFRFGLECMERVTKI